MVPSPQETMENNSAEPADNEQTVIAENDDKLQLKLENPSALEPAEDKASTPSAPVLIPSLRGLMSYVGGQITCKGKWAMSDQDHANPVMTSDFEFRLVAAEDSSSSFPVNGKYEGWFNVKQPLPLKPLRIEDREMKMEFTASGPDEYKIVGQGHNVYGKFNLRGTLSQDGSAQIFREYYFFFPLPVPAHGTKKGSDKKKLPPVQASSPTTAASSVAIPPPPVTTPRESAGRPRKPSLVMKDFQAQQVAQKEKPPKVALPLPAPVQIQTTVTSERTHRLHPSLKRCSDLLKEFTKLPQSVWFLEPVDVVKFKIPDYPKIIKKPMDYSTIRKNLDSGVYETAEDFASHMRLVFQNAMTFNSDKDSLVHVAARDLSVRFEEKLRSLLSTYQPDLVEPEPTPRSVKSTSVSASKGSSKSKLASVSMDSSKDRRKSLPGPRALQATFIPPAAADANTLMMLEMHKKMESMASELETLRATVRESTLKDRVDETVEAAKKPLDYNEKKALVTQIYKLPADKMERAMEIIRESISNGGEDGEIEIPIDSLDTYTLRRLQKFIQENLEKKKRPSSVSLSRQASSTALKEPAPKKPRKSTSGKSGSVLNPDDADLEFFDDNEPLLFENDQLDTSPLKATSTSMIASSSLYNDVDDEDDGNKWEQAVQD